jgi:glycosyltransferase involved in cell wall biosynthesis
MLIVHDNPRQVWTGPLSFRFVIPMFRRFLGELSVAYVNPALANPVALAAGASVIPNGIDDIFSSAGPSQRVRRLCYVGDVTHAKGWDLLLRQASCLRALEPKLLIHCFLSARAPQSGSHPQNIVVEGVGVAREVLATFLRGSDYVVSTTRNESFCLPVLEAMRSGCVCFCTFNLGTAQYVLHGVNAYFFDPSVPGSLAVAIAEFESLDEMARAHFRSAAVSTASRFLWRDALPLLDLFLSRASFPLANSVRKSRI